MGKKLTDEEIVKDIERSTGMPSYWKKIVLDFIHRLQGENAELLRLCEKTNGEMDKMRDEKDRQLLSQKAEIERLKRYEMSESEYQRYCAYKLIEPQIRGCLDREREIQKQVDELKETLKLRNIQLEDLRKYDKEIVKDTASEILQGFDKWLKQAISDSYDKSVKGSYAYEGGRNRAFHEVKELVKKVAESKAVEVE